jgi:AAA family ATP:ADP antiporter
VLSRFVDIRPGERKRAILAFCSLLLVIASYTVVKSVRDALFLSRFGITQLSLIAIGLAVFTGFIISIYLRTTAGTPRNWLIGGTNVVIASSLALLWLGLFSEGLAAILPWVLYIWSSIFGVFIVMQFWLLANDLFDPREGKRLFGFIGGGAILGGILGGFLSRSLAPVIGSANLLLIAAGMLLLEAVLVSAVWPLRRQEERPATQKKKKKPSGGLATLRENRMVTLLAAALLLSTMATTLLDWQFKGIVKDVFASQKDQMAAFFGSLFAYLSVASFLVQTLLTSVVLRRFGVSVGLMALPVSLLLGGGLILASALFPWLSRLVAASSAKVAEGGLRFSVDKASMELMWLPVPPDVKERGKAFVDTVIDRLGTGLTGFVWLGLAFLFGFDAPDRIHLVSLAVGVLVLVWLAVLFNARSAYLGALRAVLARRKLDPVQLGLVSAEATRSLGEMLSSDDPREIGFALHLLEDAGPGALPDLSAALAHEDATVRAEALRLLGQRGDPAYRAAAVDCLTHDSARVREAAIVYLQRSTTAADAGIADLESRGVEPATVDVIRLGVATQAMAAADDLRRQLESAELERQLELVETLGAAPPEMAAALLAPLLVQDEPRLVRAALLAAGRARARGVAAAACNLLSDRRVRRAAAEALRSLDEAAVAPLAALAADQSVPVAARQTAVQVLGALRRTEEAPLLLDLVSDASPQLARRALRALNRLRNSANLKLTEAQLEKVDRLTEAELGAVYRELLFLERGSWADLREAGRPEDLLCRNLAESVERRIERLFRLQALSHPPRDVYSAYLGVRSPLKSVRASSIEFLDNLLPKAGAQRLLPLLESAGAERFASTAKAVDLHALETRLDLIRRLLVDDADELARLVAVWTVGAERLSDLRGELEELAVRADANIAIEIKAAISRLEDPGRKEPTMGLSTIEKALKLQKADVLKEASTEDLGHIAQIATEEQFEDGAAIYSEGDTPDALFVVLEGKVKLHKEEQEIAVLGENETFGGWALVDESPRMASATAVGSANLLRVGREDFQELLADRLDIVQAVFKSMVDRLRDLANLANNP